MAICMHYLGNCSSQDYFWNILQLYSKRQYLKKIAAKCSIFLHQLYFFLLKDQEHFWRSGTNFIWGGQ